MAGAHTRCTYARPNSPDPLTRYVDDGNVAASSEMEADRSMAMFTARTDAVHIYELHCFITTTANTKAGLEASRRPSAGNRSYPQDFEHLAAFDDLISHDKEVCVVIRRGRFSGGGV